MGFHTRVVPRSWANARKGQLENFREKERFASCSVKRTCIPDAFRKVRKGENVLVVLPLLGSTTVFLFEKPTRSVPETWGRMYDVLAFIK